MSISHKILALVLVGTLAASSGRSPDVGVSMHTFSPWSFYVVPEVPVIQRKGTFQSCVRLFGKRFRVNQRKVYSYQHRQVCRKLQGAAGKLAESASCARSDFSQPQLFFFFFTWAHCKPLHIMSNFNWYGKNPRFLRLYFLTRAVYNYFDFS